MSPETSPETSPASEPRLAPHAAGPGAHASPPPIPTERRRTRPPLAGSSQPDATIPLNLEDLILESE